MIKRMLGINCNCIKDKDALTTLEKIKAVGFDSFFSDEYSPKGAVKLRHRADELGLNFEFIHAPFKGVNSMWLEGDEYLGIFSGMKESIDAAAEAGVPAVIIHLSSGWNPPDICDLGLARYDALVDYAEKKGVIIAFENLRVVGNVAYMRDKYENRSSVGFCLDFGHEHGYTKNVSFADIFTNKLLYTHIHDNFGRGDEKTGDPDLHLLPFEGNVDFKSIIKKLDKYSYKGSLMLEVFSDSALTKTRSDEEFLKLCYKKLVKISKM